MTVTRSGDMPIVTAVEGLCYAGKTTLVRAVAALTSAVIALEYTDLAPLPAWPPADQEVVSAALDQFERLERRRAAAARTQLSRRATAGRAGRVVLLDRSPLTLIAHEYGMQALAVPADPDGAARRFTAAAADATILTPDVYVYLSVPEQVTAARRAARGPVAEHLDHPTVRARISEVCSTWLDLLPPNRVLRLDGAAPVPELAATVARFLSEDFDRCRPVPPWTWLTAAAATPARPVPA